jgi:hypothetical protein
MSTIEFQSWPKIARLNRDITVTEKIDGTNAAIVIDQFNGDERKGEWSLNPADGPKNLVYGAFDGATRIVTHVYAQSRTRFITPQDDNYGFAGWVQRNGKELVEVLGAGTHFGEWWGSGIQRKYGLIGGDKRFSLFNTARWADGLDGPVEALSVVPGLGVVPVLYEGPFDQLEIERALEHLRIYGSVAAQGFGRPEGIVVWHDAARKSFKVTLENDAQPKGLAA